MKEFIIAFILIAIPLFVYFFLIKTSSSAKPKEKEETKKEVEMVKVEESSKPEQKEKTVNPKDYLIKTFKDTKDLRRCYIHHNGHVVIYSDDKRISFAYIKYIGGKGQKIISKSVDRDLISDIAYSEKSRKIAVTLKNSKNILFYSLVDDNGKTKLQQLPQSIETKRKFEIKEVVISNDGNYVSTSGTDQDTEIQIYNIESMKLIDKLETGGINNLQIKMSQDDNDILVSTFLNDISVIHFDKKEKFNNQNLGYETIVSIIRKKSISGIKEKIACFEFSNELQFFVVSTDSKTIKIMQNYGNISESKVFSEFKTDFRSDTVSLYVNSFFNGKIEGYVALVDGTDIVICDTDGNVVMRMEKAHDNEIIALKLVKVNLEENEEAPKDSFINEQFEGAKDKEGKIALISASKDGRVKIWNLKL